MQDECVNNPNGIRDGGSAPDTVMDDLNPDAQAWASSFYHTYQKYSSGCETRGRLKRPHRGPSQWLAVVCEMSVSTTQTG